LLNNIQAFPALRVTAYRKIPILGAPPNSITYTRARTRAVYPAPTQENEDKPRRVRESALETAIFGVDSGVSVRASLSAQYRAVSQVVGFIKGKSAIHLKVGRDEPVRPTHGGNSGG